MAILNDIQIQEINNAILNFIGYDTSIRQILLNGIDRRFIGLLPVLNAPYFQLSSDLNHLNKIERLTDGTVPLEMYLSKVANFVKPFPLGSQCIQNALAEVSAFALKALPIQNPQPPSPIALDNIIKEKFVHKNDMVSYAFLQGGFQAGISVARIQVPRYDNGVPKMIAAGKPAIYLGTGWLLTQKLIITNYHVINARNNNEANASIGDFIIQAENTTVQFDYDADNMEGVYVKAFKLLAADYSLDFAILELTEAVDRPPLRILPEEILVVKDDPQTVNIIQHPFGYSKKVAIRNNHIYDSQYPKVRYFTDTEGGSSGSPVFDDNWQVIALHRASTAVNNIDYNGQTTAWVNEGVQLKAIIEHLKIKSPDLASVIMGEF